MRSNPTSSPISYSDFQKSQIVFDPQAANGMKSGFDQLVRLLRPTLGPHPHFVAHEQMGARNSLPEILDSGSTIARRIVQIAGRQSDVGFMYLRHILWKQYENYGDGTATTAILFQAIYNATHRYIAAGGNAMILRQPFEDGMQVILDMLDAQTMPLRGKKNLTGLAYSICYDRELAQILGEVFDIIGEYGRLDIRKGDGRAITREYVEGMYWGGGLRSRAMANADAGLQARLENAAVLISDLPIESAEDLLPLLNLAIQHQIRQILLVSSTFSEKAMALVLNKANRERVNVVAVKSPMGGAGVQQGALEDLAVLTGGRALQKATYDSIQNVRLDDLGNVRRAWADGENFGIFGGKGDPRKLRAHILNLRQALERTNEATERKRLTERLGKLMGGSATVYITDLSSTAANMRVELAKRTAEAMRGAMREGVVLGGMVALLQCRTALRERLAQNPTDEQRFVDQTLMNALEAPFYALIENSGENPGRILAQMEQLEDGAGFDIQNGRIVQMAEAGIYDAASVVKGAVRSAVSGAALAATIEVIVHRKNPPDGLNT